MEKENDQVDRYRWLCLGLRNFGASNHAGADSSAGRRGHASSCRLRRGYDDEERSVRIQIRRPPGPQMRAMEWNRLR